MKKIKLISFTTICIIIIQILMPILIDIDWNIVFAEDNTNTWDISANGDGSVIAELSEDGTLTISGSGNMKSWAYDATTDWHSSENKEKVKNVIINEGVTSIGDYAFDGCSNLTSIIIHEGVKSIGNKAFYGCSSLIMYCTSNSYSEKYAIENNIRYVSDKYYINSSQELWEFAEKVNNGNTFKGTIVYLTKNINVEASKEKQWIPIGNCNEDSGNKAETTNDKNPFCGIFDGNNHSISGVYIDNDKNYMGLFGYNQGIIKNLNLIDSYISSSGGYIGGITAFNNNSSIIENCHNYAHIVTNTSSGACGGIVGYSTGSKILKSSNHGLIEGKNGGIGGISGYSWGTQIDECYNQGNINSKAYAVGGISGFFQTSWVENSYNKGEISGSSYIGGITAQLYKYASIIDCYNVGNLYNSDENPDRNVCIGGITGWVSLSNYDEYKMQNCYNAGTVTENNVLNEKLVYAGNIIGKYENGLINNCYYLNNEINPIGEGNYENSESLIKLNKEELKSKDIIQKLNMENDAYCVDNIESNNGYPILKFQDIFKNFNVTKVENIKYLNQITQNTTISQLKEKIETNAPIKITKGEQEITDENTLVGTGMSLQIGDETYILVVTGDLNGDGKIGLADLANLKLSMVGKRELSIASTLAGDINGDGKTSLSDLAKLKMYLVGKITI